MVYSEVFRESEVFFIDQRNSRYGSNGQGEGFFLNTMIGLVVEDALDLFCVMRKGLVSGRVWVANTHIPI